jgi:hypothetical protein
MTDRKEIINALRSMTETEAKAVFNEARASGREKRMEDAATALKQYIHGSPRTTNPDTEQ